VPGHVVVERQGSEADDHESSPGRRPGSAGHRSASRGPGEGAGRRPRRGGRPGREAIEQEVADSRW
jgi:hypothetical protein